MKPMVLASSVQPKRLMAVVVEPSVWLSISVQRFSAESTLRAEMFGADRYLSWLVRIGPIVLVGFRSTSRISE